MTDNDGNAGPAAANGAHGARRAVLALPAHRIAVSRRLPSEKDIRLRWDVATGWAALAVPAPGGAGKPRFLGFAQLAATAEQHDRRVVEVLEALHAAGFTVIADFDSAAYGLRETWIRHHDEGAGDTPTPQRASVAGAG